MDEESRFRVEDPDDFDEDLPAIMKPLPTVRETREVEMVDGKKVPIVNFLGFRMREDRRDLFVFVLIPLLVAIIDANLISLVAVDVLEESMLYMFVFPMLAAIPLGLVVYPMSRALISAIITSIFFIVVFLLFLISPAFLGPNIDVASILVAGGIIAAVYFFFVVMASLLGTLIGAILREFL